MCDSRRVESPALFWCHLLNCCKWALVPWHRHTRSLIFQYICKNGQRAHAAHCTTLRLWEANDNADGFLKRPFGKLLMGRRMGTKGRENLNKPSDKSTHLAHKSWYSLLIFFLRQAAFECQSDLLVMFGHTRTLARLRGKRYIIITRVTSHHNIYYNNNANNNITSNNNHDIGSSLSMLFEQCAECSIYIWMIFPRNTDCFFSFEFRFFLPIIHSFFFLSGTFFLLGTIYIEVCIFSFRNENIVNQNNFVSKTNGKSNEHKEQVSWSRMSCFMESDVVDELRKPVVHLVSVECRIWKNENRSTNRPLLRDVCCSKIENISQIHGIYINENRIP